MVCVCSPVRCLCRVHCVLVRVSDMFAHHVRARLRAIELHLTYEHNAVCTTLVIGTEDEYDDDSRTSPGASSLPATQAQPQPQTQIHAQGFGRETHKGTIDDPVVAAVAAVESAYAIASSQL